MAAMTLTSQSHRLLQVSPHVAASSSPKDVKLGGGTLCINCCSGMKFAYPRSLIHHSSSKAGRDILLKPVCAVGSGLEATITDSKESGMSIKNVEIVLESEEEDKMQVRVDVPGKETMIIFDKILRNLARSAPPVPGFRREKGGKTSKVPKDFLLQILGEDRVTNFVIQEIVTTTVGDYATKENLNVKENKITTTQSAEELKAVFVPGQPFGFSATLELEVLEVEDEDEDEDEESTEELEVMVDT